MESLNARHIFKADKHNWTFHHYNRLKQSWLMTPRNNKKKLNVLVFSNSDVSLVTTKQMINVLNLLPLLLKIHNLELKRKNKTATFCANKISNYRS